jgi:hypothetical protein
MRLLGVFSVGESTGEAADVAGRAGQLLRWELGDLALLPGQSRYEVSHMRVPDDLVQDHALLLWVPTRWEDIEAAVERSIDCAARVLAVEEGFAGSLVLRPVEEPDSEEDRLTKGATDQGEVSLFDAKPYSRMSERAYTHLCLSLWKDEERAQSAAAKALKMEPMFAGGSPVPQGWRVARVGYRADHSG